MAGVAVIALGVSVLLWQKLSRIQEQLARQSADTGLQALEAKTWAKQSQELVQDSAARVALMEVRLAEVALQRTQLEELMQSLSRSRDENLVVDIEAALRMAHGWWQPASIYALGRMKAAGGRRQGQGGNRQEN